MRFGLYLTLVLTLAQGGCSSAPQSPEARRAEAAKLMREAQGYERDGKPEKAIDRYKDAVLLDPDSLEIRHGLGMLYYRWGLHYESLAFAAEKAALKAQTVQDAKEMEAQRLKERELHREALPKFRRALRHLEVVVEGWPEDPELLATLCRIHLYRGEARLAKAYATRGVQTAPTTWQDRLRNLERISEQEILNE